MHTFTDADLAGIGLEDLLSQAGDDAIAIEGGGTPPGASGRIAIVGMAGRIAGCDDLDAFWDLLRDGRTTRRGLPDGRRADLDDYLRLRGAGQSSTPVHYFRESFLRDIDRFDHRFFGMARQEANLTDPNQRLFLETAWSALEHAGYGGDGIRGSSTGVFVGYSGDFGDAYRDIVRTLAPDAPEVAVVGNVKSIIASRIAYLLDLRGPSMMIDTACSSGLVALHQACRALRAGDCDMAIAGTVKIDLVPVADDPETGIGIKDIQATMASDGRTRTFDDGSEGTSGAEGVIAFVLKPLERALADGDTVHAVILGSAANQDGQSVGITAPNMAAQEALIVRALDDAGVHPDSISCIEAHGTATRLGDPVEVGAIQRAFRRYTPRRQFCAIGSVKTNIGHMDNGAGLAGLAKVVLAMRHRLLPASLHFRFPNRNIDFAASPVYVNDTARPWQPEDGQPLRAGVSSFGLSGTNCHVIVESPPPRQGTRGDARGPWLLPLSAASRPALERLVAAWRRHLRHLGDADAAPADLCFTAGAGRRHHGERLVLRFDDVGQLRLLLDAVADGRAADWSDRIAAGSFRVVDERQAREDAPGQLTEAMRKRLDRDADALVQRWRQAAEAERDVLAAQAMRLYVQGAAIDWSALHAGSGARRIPLPTTPFEPTRCWVEQTPLAARSAGRLRAAPGGHPLLGARAARLPGMDVFETMLGVDSHWELADHKVRGSWVLPGTAFIEMMLAAAARLHGGRLPAVQIERLMFLRPFALTDARRRPVQLLLSAIDGGHEVRIASRARIDGDDGGDDWDIHAEAVLRLAEDDAAPLRDLAGLRAAIADEMRYTRADDAARGLEIGDRWNLSVRRGWTTAGRDEVLVHLALPEAYLGERDRYHCHPALLDTAVNAANHLLGDGVLYLPFSYRRLEVFRPLPAEFMAHLRRKEGGSREAAHLDVELLDMAGQVCVRASDYAVKLVPESEFGGAAAARLHAVALVADEQGTQEDAHAAPLPDGPVLLVRRDDACGRALADDLRAAGVALEEAIAPAVREAGTRAAREEAGAAIRAALAAREAGRWAGVVYAAAWEDGRSGAAGQGDGAGAADTQSHADAAAAPTHAFADFLAAWHATRQRCDGPLLALTRGAFSVDGDGIVPSPSASAAAALVRIAGLENPQLRWRCIDSDTMPAAAVLLRAIADRDAGDLAVLRAGRRHRETLASLPPAQGAPRFMPRTDGVYLITGGLGALGLELAGHLAARAPVRLALLASTALPPRADWPAVRRDGALPAKLLRALDRIEAIERTGATVDCIAADVGDAARMAEVFADLRRRHGAIRGIFHAAGRAGDGFLVHKSRERFDSVIRPKIAGAWNLHALSQDDPLDVFVLYSSVATVLRSAGQADYTAGNAYLDALARLRRAAGLPAIALCWPAWRETGIAVEFGAVNDDEFFTPLATAEAMALLDEALCRADLPAAVVPAAINEASDADALAALGIALPEPLKARMARVRRRAATASAAQAAGTAAEAEVVLTGIADPDDTERELAGLWASILGMRELSADDAFGDLGGNSILTTQLYRELDRRHPGAIDVVDLFSHTTIRDQAAFLRKALGRDRPVQAAARKGGTAEPAGGKAAPQDAAGADLDRILALLAEGELSPEDAQHYLS